MPAIEPYQYRATVERIIDGDTVDLLVDLGFTLRMTLRFRIAGVDAPEIYGEKKASAEYKAGKAASEFVEELIPPGSAVTIRTSKAPSPVEWAAEVFAEDGTNVGEALLEAGHATPANW